MCGARPDLISHGSTCGRSKAVFTASSVLWGGPAGLYDVTRDLGAMLCAGDASDVDGERLEGAQRGVSEGALSGHSPVLGAFLRPCSRPCALLTCPERAYASPTVGWYKKNQSVSSLQAATRDLGLNWGKEPNVLGPSGPECKKSRRVGKCRCARRPTRRESGERHRRADRF